MCGQMAPHATQTRIEVLVLGELDLQTTFATCCMQGEDIKYERRSIDNFYGFPDDALEVALLGGRKLVVEYNDVGTERIYAFCELLGLASPDEGARIGRIELLGHRMHDLGTRRLNEALELGHGLSQWPVGVSAIDTDEYGPLGQLLGDNFELRTRHTSVDLELEATGKAFGRLGRSS